MPLLYGRERRRDGRLLLANTAAGLLDGLAALDPPAHFASQQRLDAAIFEAIRLAQAQATGAWARRERAGTPESRGAVKAPVVGGAAVESAWAGLPSEVLRAVRAPKTTKLTAALPEVWLPSWPPLLVTARMLPRGVKPPPGVVQVPWSAVAALRMLAKYDLVEVGVLDV